MPGTPSLDCCWDMRASRRNELRRLLGCCRRLSSRSWIVWCVRVRRARRKAACSTPMPGAARSRLLFPVFRHAPVKLIAGVVVARHGGVAGAYQAIDQFFLLGSTVHLDRTSVVEGKSVSYRV